MEPSLSSGSQRSPAAATSTFPSPLPGPASQRAPSVISSRMTDIASEDGDEFHTGEAATGQRPGTAVSTEPTRPGSSMSAQTRPSTRAPPSRRGIGSTGAMSSWRTGGTFGGPGGSITNSSRPTSSTSRTSRTHVPSLASHAFFRPMSSQRLQAQRGARPARTSHSTTNAEDTSDGGTTGNRQSLVSDATVLRGRYSHLDSEGPPPSRGTEFTEQDDQGTLDASLTEHVAVRGVDKIEKPLHHKASNPRPIHMSLDTQANGSPKSYRTNFSMSRKEAQGHKRLSSSNNSPTFAKEPPDPRSKAGINYQYFSGNTVFFWGGRLQNTRDRPVNIASGIIVILPAILFLVYS
ncbi:Eukaryotic peptide chain release factor GTP-binding subunit [Lecanora helva]